MLSVVHNNADMDLDLIKQIRESGQMFNYRDWDRQPGLTSATQVQTISIF